MRPRQRVGSPHEPDAPDGAAGPSSPRAEARHRGPMIVMIMALIPR
jgi:hypothetical protein